MWPFPNPLDLFGDAIGSVAGWAWDKVIQGIYTWFADGLLLLMEWVWGVLDTATTPRLTEAWFETGLVRPLAGISLGITMAMMLGSAVQAGFGGRPELIVDALKEGPKAIVASALTVTVMDVLIRGSNVIGDVAWQAGGIAGGSGRGVEEDGDGSVIHQRHLHVGGENPGFDGQALPAQNCAEVIIKPPALFRRRGFREAGAVAAFHAICGEGELADGQDSAFDGRKGKVHLLRLVLEDAELGDLARQTFRLPVRIALHRADEHEKATADGTGYPALDRDGGL